jgi:hypothetical protein
MRAAVQSHTRLLPGLAGQRRVAHHLASTPLPNARRKGLLIVLAFIGVFIVMQLFAIAVFVISGGQFY